MEVWPISATKELVFSIHSVADESTEQVHAASIKTFTEAESPTAVVSLWQVLILSSSSHLFVYRCVAVLFVCLFYFQA